MVECNRREPRRLALRKEVLFMEELLLIVIFAFIVLEILKIIKK